MISTIWLAFGIYEIVLKYKYLMDMLIESNYILIDPSICMYYNVQYYGIRMN